MTLSETELLSSLCRTGTNGLTEGLGLSQSQTEVSQSQVSFHFLDGCRQGHRLVQNTESPLAMAWERKLEEAAWQ